MGFGESWANLTRKIGNKMPGKVWPYKVIVFGLYDLKRGFVIDTDLMRRTYDENGNPIFICKNTSEKFIPPKEGFEDKNGYIYLLKTGDEDYKFVKGVEFDREAESLIVGLHDDEQMKFLFAQTIRKIAERYKEPAPWWNSAMVALLVIAAAVILSVLIVTGQLNGLTDQINHLSVVLQNLGGTLGETAGSVGSARPPI